MCTVLLRMVPLVLLLLAQLVALLPRLLQVLFDMLQVYARLFVLLFNATIPVVTDTDRYCKTTLNSSLLP